jgi:hypothetical protein
MSQLIHRLLRREALVALAGAVALVATMAVAGVADSSDGGYCDSTTPSTAPAEVIVPTAENVLGPHGPLGADGPLGPHGAVCTKTG